MSLKEFLKPDWKKILIFFVLIFVTIFLIGIPYWAYPMCESGSKCPLLFHFTPPDKILSSNIHLSNGFRIDFIVLFIELLIIYLISSIIIWIYDKVKKK
jgi:hypothetical protein